MRRPASISPPSASAGGCSARRPRPLSRPRHGLRTDSAHSFLRRTAGRSNGGRLSSGVAGVAVSSPGKRDASIRNSCPITRIYAMFAFTTSDLAVESGAGAPALGSDGVSVAFAPGLSPAPMAAFPVPRSPNPACQFPALGSPVGSCGSHTEDRSTGSDGFSGHRVLRWPLWKMHGFHTSPRFVLGPPSSLSTPRWCRSVRRKFVVQSDPSLMHVMHPESSAPTGVIGIATPVAFFPSVIPPHLRPLSSTGITRRPQSYGPLRHPAGPACPSRGSGWSVRSTDRASRVATLPLFHACRRHYPGGAGRCARRPLPDRWQPSPLFRRVGLRVARFEACSTFTRVAARTVAEPPKAARCTEVLQSKSLPPSTAPIATSWSDTCRAGFAPAEGRHLSTAH